MTGAATSATLPHWDMTVVYPGLDSPEFKQEFDALLASFQELEQYFDERGVERRDDIPVSAEFVSIFEEVLNRYNAVLTDLETMWAYLYAFIETDSRDTVAQARFSELRQRMVTLDQLGTRFDAWVGAIDLDALSEKSELAREHAFPLQMARIDAAHLMSPAEENLAAELYPAGAGAWAKLHGDLTSQIEVELAGKNGDALQVLPMSAIRNLASDSDRDVRHRAYQAELAAWEATALPLAAAINGVKGEVITLTSRRGWASPLDQALHINRVDRETLTAMMDATADAFPDLRRYLKVKARAIGVPALAWYDLFAPMAQATGADAAARWSWDRGTAFVTEHFGAYSPRMRGLAERALAERWIDAEPRPGKTDGGFCMALRGDESRILVNYSPSYGGVSTVAHELGHAYHNLNEAGLTPLQRQTPMVLAETASTFCETVIRDAALREAPESERAGILEGSLQDAFQVTADITSRFRFEQRAFERRQERELSVEELCELMLETQHETYGDGLDQSALHPYMWAVKGHYYSRLSFYNFPYMFGLLFGLGLYATAGDDPERFRAGYDDLLSWTGRAGAATLAARFGIDTRSREFWESSLAQVIASIDQYERLVDASGADS
ncbi:MAG: M3 family oligoendopeptidase [Thermomicrobiales bacterium]